MSDDAAVMESTPQRGCRDTGDRQDASTNGIFFASDVESGLINHWALLLKIPANTAQKPITSRTVRECRYGTYPGWLMCRIICFQNKARPSDKTGHTLFTLSSDALWVLR